MGVGFIPAARAATAADRLYVSASGADVNPGDDPAAPLATLAAAYDALNDGGTIVLLSDLSLKAPATFAQSKTVTIDGGGNTVTYTGAATVDPEGAGVFTVKAGLLELADVTVRLPEQRGANGRALYIGPGGAAILHSGATLANGYLGYGGGVAKVDGGSLTMEDGAAITGGYIVNNTTAYGGGVLVSAGTFIMTGGTVEGNTMHTTQGYANYGGGVAVMAGATFMMTGGSIEGNTVDTAAGGVYVAPGGTLELGGTATITGNTASSTASNLYLPTTGVTFRQTSGVTGSVDITHGQAAYNVIVGVPGVITVADEAAYTYDTGGYDIRLKGGNLVLYKWTVAADITGTGYESSYTENETPTGEDFDTTLTADEGYQLPSSITVEIGGVELDRKDYTYDPETGEVHIPGALVTDDIRIIVTADALHTISISATNVTVDVSTIEVIQADNSTFTFTKADRYALPVTVTVTGSCTHTYNTGILVISNVTGNVTVTAAGAEIPHTIYLNAGEGTVNPATVSINESQPAIGALPTPTRTGYTFTGWFTASGDKVTAATPNHLTADLYLTARWSADTNIGYRVEHWVELVDSGANPGYIQGVTATRQMGHMGVQRTYYLYASQDYNNGVSDGHKDITPLALAELDGLDLRGLTPSGANVYSVTMAPDGSSVFPLFYDRNPYTVTFDPNGGSIAQGDAQASVRYGSLYGALPGAARTGYTLTGWFTEATGGTNILPTDTYLQVGDQTLYAHWTSTGTTPYTVVHMVQELRDNLVSYDKTPAAGAYSLHLTDALTGHADTEVDVYALAIPGHVPSLENVYSVLVEADGSGSVALYYDRAVTTVGYDANGGALAAPGLRTVLYYGGTVSSLAAAPSRSGYNFDGWYLEPGELAQRVTVRMPLAEINPDNLSTLTLYAHWTKRPTPPAPPSGGGSAAPTKPAQETGEHIAYLKGYPDGTVRPTSDIARCEAAAIFCRLLPEELRAQYEAASSFKDVPAGSWYGSAVGALAAMGVITGLPDGTFAPMAPMTRGEFAAMAARFAEVMGMSATGSQGTVFDDLGGHWAGAYITRAAALGWVQGDGSGAYRPDANMSRAETVTLVNRVFNRSVTAAGMLPGMLTFPDNPAGAWYYTDIQEAANSHTYTRAPGEREIWSGLLR
jgi:uncharacterized repeat protein (TIGR02543 family)